MTGAGEVQVHAGRRRAGAVGIVLVLFVALAAACGSGGDAGTDADRGNVVVVMTDDQTLASLSAMPLTRRWLAEEGTTFEVAVASLPLCCPSRAAFLTGQLAHNNGVYDNVPPNGGVRALDASQTMAVWLQDAGVITSHVGKYLNGYAQLGAPTVPAGWDRWFGTIDPTTYDYFGATAFDGRQVVEIPGYLTDALSDRAVVEVEAMSEADEPFFLSLNHTAPHTAQPEVATTLSLADLGGQVDLLLPPAPGREDVVAGETTPQTPGVLESDVADKPAWIRSNQELVDTLVAQTGVEAAFDDLRDRYYRNYLSTLVAVDEGVDRLMRTLEETGELDDTLVVFTSDNGYHFGEHGLLLRKATPYEESIRVPMLVRVPGATGGGVVRSPVANVDVTATVLDWMGVEPGLPADGTSLLPLVDDPSAGADRVVLLQSTERGNGGAPPYVGVRTPRYSYVEYANGELELYDLEVDPDQLENRAGDVAYEAVVQQLEVLVDELSTCVGADCTVTAAVPGPAGG